MGDADAQPRPPVLDPVEVLRTLTGTGAIVEVIFGPGSEASGSIVASSPDVSVLQNLDGTATFVRHDAVQAVTVREANAFRTELGLTRPMPGTLDVAESGAAAAGSVGTAPSALAPSAGPGGPAGASATSTAPAAPVPPPPLSPEEVAEALAQVGYEYDEGAVVDTGPNGRAGLIALASVVDAALRSIAGDSAANDAMEKDVDEVRLADGPAPDVAIAGTTLVVTAPWTRGPEAIPSMTSVRGAILDAAKA